MKMTAEKDARGSGVPEQELLAKKMLETRSVMISGEIDKEMSEAVIKQLLLLEAESDAPIKVMINSPGGDADAGFAVFDMIRFVKPLVYTIGVGLVASAGALILLAAPREQRIGLPNSNYLIHQPLSGIRGVATEIEIHARQIEKLRTKINRLISDETGRPLEQVERDTDRDCWLDAGEAVEYGLISRVVGTRDQLGL
jgi:ATP-dependent Clp protease, protease subunit